MSKDIDRIFKNYHNSLTNENSNAIYKMLVEVRALIVEELNLWNISKPEMGSFAIQRIFTQFKDIREGINLPSFDEKKRQLRNPPYNVIL